MFLALCFLRFFFFLFSWTRVWHCSMSMNSALGLWTVPNVWIVTFLLFLVFNFQRNKWYLNKPIVWIFSYISPHINEIVSHDTTIPQHWDTYIELYKTHTCWETHKILFLFHMITWWIKSLNLLLLCIGHHKFIIKTHYYAIG